MEVSELGLQKRREKVDYKVKDFENKLQQFEDISNKLSSADISLNESLELFEKGNKIYFDLKKILDEAENKILTLEGNEFIENEDIKFE